MGPMNIKEDISAFLKANNCTQAELARRAKIHPIIISRLLRGERNGLHSKTLEKLWPVIHSDKPQSD